MTPNTKSHRAQKRDGREESKQPVVNGPAKRTRAKGPKPGGQAPTPVQMTPERAEARRQRSAQVSAGFDMAVRPDLRPPTSPPAGQQAATDLRNAPVESAESSVEAPTMSGSMGIESTGDKQQTVGQDSQQNRPKTSESEGDQVSNVPAEQYIIPFDRAPLAARGERIIFGAVFTDPNPDDYEIRYTAVGGTFNSRSGAATVTHQGVAVYNQDFFIPSGWTGNSTVRVTMQLRRRADNHVMRTETWNFGNKPYYPTKMAQVESTGERDLPAVYSYDIGPARKTGTAPFYEHQTILEKFQVERISNIKPEDIKPEFVKQHGLTSKGAISAHFGVGGSGQNGTFTVDALDRIYDQHGGHADVSGLVAQLKKPKEIWLDLPQTYESQPGVQLGKYTVRRIRKTDGSWKVKKW